ncbi:conserved hypothetical protein [Ricinus communis]|uniref:Uncharacterized protein n=1 Tax=Ricinus communis TaxID=3988 RepID=B9SYL7_RICCO|nr:conserved hypothetical protein [Ricinus communis]
MKEIKIEKLHKREGVNILIQGGRSLIVTISLKVQGKQWSSNYSGGGDDDDDGGGGGSGGGGGGGDYVGSRTGGGGCFDGGSGDDGDMETTVEI